MKNKNSILASTLLAGTIIGAGIFSLPYIFSQLGLILGLIYLIFFAFVYFFIHLMYAQILKKQEGEHQFFYLAHQYFSQKVANFISYLIFLELIFVMLVYLVLAPTFIGLIFHKNLFFYFLFFWFLSSIFIFIKTKILGFADFLGIFSILLIIFIVFLNGENNLTIPFIKEVDYQILLLPFGPLLFSFSGRPALHKVIEIHKKTKNFSLKKSIFWGTMIPVLVYLLFIFSILRINPHVSPEALSSLSFLPNSILILLGILGLITLFTSYFMIGINVKDILILDLKKPFWLSAFLVLFLPLILYFLGFDNFLFVISFVGSIFLGVEGILVIKMWQKAFPLNRFKKIANGLYLIFTIAIFYEIISFFK